ncbi:Crp/Fnr family transcriptional regulator [Nostoc sp. 106C]|uniref:Crp/Fnr family transcriptional regulator n=1 Tax=Nostoc sp. 106C TaxID=1932667 RepID=UPI000A37597A|nr:Crp/Fnr family transcriptional regulator [Nostoc sp. 106C]OUL18301.1 Crp/Fnr family transcriptional regulator [Nostoc sp. 106C]
MSSENRLLAALSPELSEKLAPCMKRVLLHQGERLHDAGETIEDIYFPIDCLLSITITMSDGSTAETGLVGNREMLGVNAFMGGNETTQTEYTVQVAGSAIKAKARAIRKGFDSNPELRSILLRYTQALIAQISQTAACNRLHVLEQRLARWLLESQDRLNSDNLMLTQEFIADMLGVRRAGVTQAAQKLQENGLIEYKRGHVHILNQQGLEAAACECFTTLREEYDRLLENKQKACR